METINQMPQSESVANKPPTQQDIKKLLSTKMPEKNATFDEWQHYNEQQYSVLLIPEATTENKKSAMENLLTANKMLFLKRAKEEKLMNVGIEFDDVVQIEMLNFLESLMKASDSGATTIPAYVFDNYKNKKKIWEDYSPCGIKASYATKKRQVAKDTYSMQRVSFVEEAAEAMSAKTKFTRNEAVEYAVSDKKMFGATWIDELRTGLDSVLDELTDFEANILLGIAQGLSNVEIAEHLNISESSVRRYLPGVLEKARTVATENGLDAYVHDLYA